MRLEHAMKRILLPSIALGPALLLALAIPGTALGAGPIATAPSCSGTTDVQCNLYAEPGSVSLPGALGPTTVWGYATASGGSPQLPGPAIVVTQGATVTIHLTNHLPQATSLVVEGLTGAPDLTAVASGGTHDFTFVAGAPGTYLYEAGILPGSEYQASMGLHGALIVRPGTAADRAYAGADTAFTDETAVVLSEIDPNLNNAPQPEAFDLRDFAPRWFLVNGAAYTTSQPAIPVTAGSTLLVRYLNAGNLHHSVGVLGLHQKVVGADGSQLPARRTMVAETIAPGQTEDVLISLPATTAASTLYPVYDAALTLNNSTASGIGGMLALLDAAPGASGGDTTGPITSSATIAMPSGALSASVDDATTGGADVAAAEYFIDVAGAGGSGTPMSGTPAPPAQGPITFTATIPPATLSALSSGLHTLYIHGQDSIGNWGASATVVLDKAGPVSSGLSLSPNPSDGTSAVVLTGFASDAASGGATVDAAEYFLGATGTSGSGTVLTLGGSGATRSFSGSIAAQTSNKTVYVHAHDTAGNWGGFAQVSLVVDTAGPVTSGLTATPPTSNGSTGQSPSNPTVRVTASVSDALRGNQLITAAEAYFDSIGAPGTGLDMSPSDGAFSSPSEAVQVDIPLATINALSSGNHTIYVRGRDAANNWGDTADTASLGYLIDRTAPTLASISLAAINPAIGGGIRMTLGATSDPGGALASGVTGGEYWLDTATRPAAGGTPFTGTGVVTIPAGTLTSGSHTVYARVRDAAGNYSTPTRSATVSITAVPIFSNSFETGARPWGWTSASTTNTSRLNVTTFTVLEGAQSLQAQGGNSNYVQYNWSGTANPASPTYDARFLFRPNGNASTGQDILVLASNTNYSNANTLAHVRYRLNGGTAQVQLQVGSTANATWVSLLAGTNVIEVVWQSVGTAGPAPGTYKLYLNGSATAAQSLAVSSTASVTSVRFGSVTSGGSTTPLEFFDAFASKRSVTTLFGP